MQASTVEDTARLLAAHAGRRHRDDRRSRGRSSKFADTYIEVCGSEGALRVGWSRSRFRQASSPEWIEFGSGYDKVVAHARQVENFSRRAEGRRTSCW